jgi:ubiquinone/menaquinone biosynthesis C-methylase UbiE
MDVLLARERRERLDPDRVISLIPIRPYHVVADIGCGPGFFAVPLAKYVNQGWLYALDSQEAMVEACRQRLAKARLNNAEVTQSGVKGIPLEAESLDGALVAFVLHETSNKKALLKAAHGALRKGGWLALLDWHKQEMDDGPPLKQRIDVDEARGLAEGAGLRFVAQRDLNATNYMLLFRK